MKSFSKLLLILFLSLFGNISVLNIAYADENYIISEESSMEDVEKIQTIFQSLGIYSGEIDGEYTSIEGTIVTLQKELSLISSEYDDLAGKVDVTLLKRIISKYKETPERKVLLAEQQAEETKLAEQQAEADRLAQIKYAEDAAKEVEAGERKFIVTAYYSPLPGQNRYSTGTYWGDIRLNGEGTHGASGAAVRNGFFAAPSNYPFGTTIYLEGIGTGVVEDRGGAILNAGKRGYEYDRIDVWMGYGDTGLTKALNWGKRTVNGKILGDGAEVVDGYINSEYYGLTVTPNSTGDSVKKLQELLEELGYYKGNIDGNYESVESALMTYQKAKSIIIDNESHGAGYFGTKTFAAALKDLTAISNDTIEETVQVSSEEEAVEENNEEIIEVVEEQEVEDIYPLLSAKEESSLSELTDTLSKKLSQKAGGNRILEEKYIRAVRLKLENIIKTLTSEKSIQKLQYILDSL